ncbi:MAG TPA: DHH family phosphoesterase, partial [Candidatus Baltobacteraceae bacterium]|nr:DHH family phosphoesterase [Candidatus Baltobacteraceae bacterium]
MIETRNSTAQEVVAELRRRAAFVMVSHVKPDGDTLGAGLALGVTLKRLGKRVHYFQQDPVPRNLRFLPDTEYVARAIPADLPPDTLYVFCDMSDFSRAGEYLPNIDRANMLDIDHHLGNSHFGALNYVIPTECSTGTTIMHLLRELNVEIDRDIATCILTTIMTDTGGFMHSNTTPEVLELSAELIRAGADKEEITEEIFANRRVAATRLLGRVIDEMQFGHAGRYCFSHVDDPMLKQTGGDGEDTEDVVNVL